MLVTGLDWVVRRLLTSYRTLGISHVCERGTYFFEVAPTLSPWKFRNPPRACSVGQERFSVYSPCVFGHAARTGARSFRDGAAETDC
jgi:hypothetical protein